MSENSRKSPAPALTRRGALALLGGLPLAACSQSQGLLDDLLGEKDTVLPGKRESILDPSAGLRVSNEPVAIPAAVMNGSWAQPGGNARNANHNLALGRNLKRAFAISAGSGSDSSGRLSAPPIVTGGRIYVLDAKARVRAFSASSGRKAWAVSLVPKGGDEDDGYGGGLASDGRAVYAATGFGEVVALNAATGGELWRRKLALPVRTALIVSGGRVYVRDSGDTLYALSAADGSEQWKQQGEAARTSLISASAPAAGGGEIIAPFSSGDLAAFSTQGYALWSENLASGETIKDIAARPVIEGGVVYGAAASGSLAAIKAGSGSELWSISLGGRQTPCLAGQYLFHISGRNHLSAVARSNGAIKWTTTLPGGTWSGPVMGGGRLLAASSKGVLAEISPQTGQVMSKRDIGEAVYIAPIIANATLYILADDATLMAFR